MVHGALFNRTLLNLVLLLAVGGLAAVALLEPGKTPPAVNPAVTPLKAEQVNMLRIEREGEAPVVLERRGKSWRMTSPRDLPAHGIRAAMATAAAEAESLSRVEHPADPAQYQLEPPRLRLTLNDTELRFGDIDPLHQRRYLRVGESLHLVADTLYPAINRGWPHFVDDALLPAEAKIDAVALPDGTRLQRKEAGWSVTPEGEGRSADAAMKLVDAWRFGRALEVSAYSGEGAEEETVVLTLAEGAELRFSILQRTPQLILARPDLGLRYHMGDEGRGLLSLEATPEVEH